MASQFYEVDRAGDLILSIGSDEDENHQLIRVSSKILALASPVLAALLSPKFGEGRSLASPTVTPQISLPEDDPEAMIWLCEALHFRKQVHEKITFPLLKSMAVLCDKYDLSIALGPWSEMWMQEWQGSVKGIDPYPQMLWIAYALNNHNCFWKVSKELMRLYTSEGLVLASKEVIDGILPDRIWDFIKTEHESALLHLQTNIENMITAHLIKECPQTKTYESNPSGCDHLGLAGHFLSELIRLGLWPIKQILSQTNLSTFSSQLLHFKPYHNDPLNNQNRHNQHQYFGGFAPDYTYASACLNKPPDFKTMLKKAVDEASGQQQGLCLYCVKCGLVTNDEGNCRAANIECCRS